MIAHHSLGVVALALLISSGCDSAFILDSNGSIQVAISTRGQDLDPDGYSLTVDGRQAYVLPAAGSLVLQLDRGDHTVLVGGLSDNCTVDGPNPRSVVVGGDGAVSVSFTVVCARATTGGFKVVVSTSGASADLDGYELFVAGAQESVNIPPNASEIFLDLTPGVHLITLKGVAEGCALVGGNPRRATLIAGKTVTVRLDVSCGGGNGA
jgi:hypothetical protein